MRAECLVRCEFSAQVCYVGANRGDDKGGGDGDDNVVAMLAAVLVMAVVMTVMVVVTVGVVATLVVVVTVVMVLVVKM